MQLQATINDVNTFSAYGYVNDKEMYLYANKRTNYWKVYFEVHPKEKWYDFEKVFNHAMTNMIQRYRPKQIRINTKFNIKPVALCNQHGYKFEREKNKIILDKL